VAVESNRVMSLKFMNTFFPSNAVRMRDASRPWERPRCLSPVSGASPTTETQWWNMAGKGIQTPMAQGRSTKII